MQRSKHCGARGLVILLVIAALSAQAAAGAWHSGAQATTSPTALETQVRQALESPGWTELPDVIDEAYLSGPTPAAKRGEPAGAFWFSTKQITDNARPRLDANQEAAFVRSIEAAHAGATRVIEGGRVLLVDPQNRIWAIAEHMPHLLRGYDGTSWTYRRVDGALAADDEPAAFARRVAEGTVPQPDYSNGTERDLNDPGRWYNLAFADADGNVHFVGACVSTVAEARGVSGGGVHTLRPDGSWEFFQIYPVEMRRTSMPLRSLRCVLHEAATPGDDLVTVASFTFSDPVAQMHGHTVQAIPADADELRRQQWEDWTEYPRNGPRYLLRYDGTDWRVERSSIGWGVYDMVVGAWPLPDGRVLLSNRFGIWVHWPRNAEKHVERLVRNLLGNNQRQQRLAHAELASMGAMAIPALEQAMARRGKGRAGPVIVETYEWALRVARGEKDAVPAVNGRWRMFNAGSRVTMPDGRLVWHCERVVDVIEEQEFRDCFVLYDPVNDRFEIRPVDRQQWIAEGFAERRTGGVPIGHYDSSVVDATGGIWLPGGFRCEKDGRVTRLVPPGLTLQVPHVSDRDGRVYSHDTSRNLYVFDAASGQGPARPANAVPAVAEREVHVDHVRGLFYHPDLPPPWNTWAVQVNPDQSGALLRLSGPRPRRINTPVPIQSTQMVIPLDGGCIVAGKQFASFWDGSRWQTAPTLRALVAGQGRRIAKMAPPRVLAGPNVDALVPEQRGFFLASDGRGGLWLGERHDNQQGMWHWDGTNFTDLWTLLPLEPRRRGDGIVMTTAKGLALVVQVGQDGQRPGGYWAIWHATNADVGDRDAVPDTVTTPGLTPILLASLGANTTFGGGLWSDREGWFWSRLFSHDQQRWVRRLGSRAGPTALGSLVREDSFVQPAGGPVWCVSRGTDHSTPMVLVDIGPQPSPDPATIPREVWASRHIEGMDAAATLGVAPGGEVYLLHKEGISLLRLTNPTGAEPADRPELEEVARRPWPVARNDLAQIAFDETGAWILPQTGPLIRTPLPKPPLNP